MAKHLSADHYISNVADKRDAQLLSALIDPVLDNLVAGVNSVRCRAINTPGLVEGTSAATAVKFTNSTLVCVDGTLALIAAATEVAFTATTDDITEDYSNIYIMVSDSEGTCSLIKGTEALTTAGHTAIVPPVVPTSRAVIGVVHISAAGGIFNATTTNLSGGTATTTYYDGLGPWDPKASTTD